MKKLVILILGICVLSGFQNVHAKTIKRVYNVPSNDINYCCPYVDDLAQIESYLFGQTFPKEAPGLRLNRIEECLFNKTYPTMNIAQRMNRALENYRDDYYDRNYLTQYSNNSTLRNRVRNRFFGTPTGFTPPMMNIPFSTGGFIPGINYGNVHNRSYKYGNFVPANMGTGITILD